MIEITLCLVLPLGLRYLASHRMRRLAARTMREDAALRQLMYRYERIADQLRETRVQQRQREVRRSHLVADIQVEQERLAELCATDSGRMAA